MIEQKDLARQCLLDMSFEQLSELMSSHQLPLYRAEQLFEWMHQRGVLDFSEMTNLPHELRQVLSGRFHLSSLRLADQTTSSDGSVKYLWLTERGNPVEAVLMPTFKYGAALCVSVESGCGLGCKFCQTGYLGKREQLSVGMILEQLYQAERLSGQSVDRLVVMGMGEPLLNLNAVSGFVDTMLSNAGRAWSGRRIMISTVGLVKQMVTMARSFPRINLALSLHGTTDKQRAALMPNAEKSLKRLIIALHYYRKINGGKISLEYTLIDGVNDQERDIARLARFANLEVDGIKAHFIADPLVATANKQPDPSRMQPLPLHVNLLAFNPIPAAPQFRATPEKRIDEIGRQLRDAGVPVTVRHSKGQDINAACGMLGATVDRKNY